MSGRLLVRAKKRQLGGPSARAAPLSEVVRNGSARRCAAAAFPCQATMVPNAAACARRRDVQAAVRLR